MATYIILSHISPEAVKDPKNFKDLAKTVSDRLQVMVHLRDICSGLRT